MSAQSILAKPLLAIGRIFPLWAAPNPSVAAVVAANSDESKDEEGLGAKEAENREVPPFDDPTVGEIQTPVVRIQESKESVASVPLAREEATETVNEDQSIVVAASSPKNDPRVTFQSRLLNLAKLAMLGKDGDYMLGEVLGDLFSDPQEVPLLCEKLSRPFCDVEKKIVAVFGIGGHGGILAKGVAEQLSAFCYAGETQHVMFVPVERNEQGRLSLASVGKVAKRLRGARVILVIPALTKSTCAEAKECIQLIEDGVGANISVIGLSSLLQLDCDENLPQGRIRKGLLIRPLYRMGYDRSLK